MRVRNLAGLGDATVASAATMAASGAATTASLLGGISAATTAAGGGLLAGVTVFGMAASAAIPLIGAAVAGLTSIALLIANQFKGCGQSCIQATAIANQVEPYLAQNITTYLNSPVHFVSMQAAALNNFDTAWAALVQACGQVGGQGGAGCISGRQQGACDYKTNPCGMWQQDASGNWSVVKCGANGSGSACWDWFIGYRDPIATDPTVVPDPVAGATQASTEGSSTTLVGAAGGTAVTAGASAATQAAAGTTSGIPMPLILIGAAAVLGMTMMSGGSKR